MTEAGKVSLSHSLNYAKRRQVIAYEARHKCAKGMLELRAARTWKSRKRIVYKWSLVAFETGYARSDVLSLSFWDELGKVKNKIAASVNSMVDTAEKYAEHAGQVLAAQIETVYNTAVQTFYGAGRWIADEINTGVWGYRYQDFGDHKVRHAHHEVNGVTLPRDDEFWLIGWPPNGWNCRCITVPLYRSAPIVKPPKGWQPDEGFDKNNAVDWDLEF